MSAYDSDTGLLTKGVRSAGVTGGGAVPVPCPLGGAATVRMLVHGRWRRPGPRTAPRAAGRGTEMRKRRTAWSITYFLVGGVFLLLAVLMAVGVVLSAGRGRVLDLILSSIVFVVLGVPGAVLTFRAPVVAVAFGPAGVRYSGLLGTRSYPWSEIREVRIAVLPGKVYSSDVPELVLASGGTDLLLMLAGHGSGRTNRRVKRLVAELEAVRSAVS